MRIPHVLLTLILGASLAIPAWAQPKPPPTKNNPVPDSTRTTVQANNAFACDMLRELAKEKPDKNAFFSPWSISSTLAMTMEGSRGQTAQEMGLILRLPRELHQAGDRPWNLEPYHTGFADLQRRCTGPRDTLKDQATRAKLAEMRKELQTLNQKIQANPNDKKVFTLQAQASKLASSINQLQEQVDLFELHLANAIWGEKTYPFDPAFAQSVARYYGTDLLRQADFINQFPAERMKINRWVEDQTKERIKDLIPVMPPEIARRIRMILVNAIYFKGQWSDPFEKKFTKQEPFLLSDGSKTEAMLMRNTLTARYAAFQGDGNYFATPRFTEPGSKEKTYPEGDGFLMAELPYKGNKLAMVVIAPQRPSGLPALEANLTSEKLTNWMSRLDTRVVQVTLPKFKMDTSYSLADTLKRMGMKQAFEERQANFKGMSASRNPEDNLSISHVLHKAFVEVNEEGTEAAAATAVIMAVPTSAIPVLQPFVPVFRADRPYLFLIREVDTGAILFLGRMTTPRT